MTTTIGYSIEYTNDSGGQRISAINADDLEIVGAYRPGALNDWRIYISKTVQQLTGQPQPHKAHVCSREEALAWIDTIAWMYVTITYREQRETK